MEDFMELSVEILCPPGMAAPEALWEPKSQGRVKGKKERKQAEEEEPTMADMGPLISAKERKKQAKQVGPCLTFDAFDRLQCSHGVCGHFLSLLAAYL